MPDNDMSEGDEEKAMYHMGFAYLGRLNLLLTQCNEAARIENIEEWYKCLQNLYKELEAEMNKGEIEDQDKYLATSEKHYDTFTKASNNYIVTISNTRQKNLPFYVPKEVSTFMFKWELSLRRIIKRIGMLMPSADDPRFAMMG